LKKKKQNIKKRAKKIKGNKNYILMDEIEKNKIHNIFLKRSKKPKWPIKKTKD